MKLSIQFLKLLIILFAFPLMAQWSSVPSAPMVVSNVVNHQRDVSSFPDDNGGVYIFWRDSRETTNVFAIYGQHYDETGQALWEENGREIVAPSQFVSSYNLMFTDDGKIFIAWVKYNSADGPSNGIFMQRINAEGAFMWDNIVQLKSGSSQYVKLIESDGEYYVGMQGTIIGGASKIFLNKFTEIGTLLWPYDEYNVVTPGGNSVGGVYFTSDNSGGLYVYHSSGNGSGAQLYCQHVGETPLNTYWPNWINVTTQTNGLNYQFSAIGDDEGVTLCWVGNGVSTSFSRNIYSRRLIASTGQFAWSDTTRTICEADGAQDRFFWKKSGDTYFITWSDSRPGVVGNSAIYARKFNKAGIVFWEANGIQVADLNTYIPYPEFDLDEDNTMMVCHETAGILIANKVYQDGTVEWQPNGSTVLGSNYNPFYEDYNITYINGKYLAISAAFASGGGADGIYMNNIIHQVVELSQTEVACNSFTIDDQTFNETGIYTIDTAHDTIITLDLTIYVAIAEVTQDGNTLSTTSSGDLQWFNCDTGIPVDGANGSEFTPAISGNYALIVNNGPCTDTSICFDIVTGISELDANLALSVYPNPGSDKLLIDIESFNLELTEISIYDEIGQMIYTQSSCQSIPCSINTENLKPGIYYLELKENNRIAHSKWVKIKN